MQWTQNVRCPLHSAPPTNKTNTEKERVNDDFVIATVRIYDLIHDWRVLIPFTIVGVLIVLAAYYFKKNSKKFAEMI